MFSPDRQCHPAGYIVINQTEALVRSTSIPAASTREHHHRDTALQHHTSRLRGSRTQLRLRDLAGLIVIASSTWTRSATTARSNAA